MPSIISPTPSNLLKLFCEHTFLFLATAKRDNSIKVRTSQLANNLFFSMMLPSNRLLYYFILNNWVRTAVFTVLVSMLRALILDKTKPTPHPAWWPCLEFFGTEQAACRSSTNPHVQWFKFIKRLIRFHWSGKFIFICLYFDNKYVQIWQSKNNNALTNTSYNIQASNNKHKTWMTVTKWPVFKKIQTLLKGHNNEEM